MTLISSRRNQYFKTARSLLAANQRRKQKKFLAEGEKYIAEAFKANIAIDFILYTAKAEQSDAAMHAIATAESKQIPCFKIKENLFEEISDTETPQGILACVHFPDIENYDLKSKTESFFIMVDGIQDPGNLGTLIRLADAAGVDRVFLNKGTVDQFNSKVLRSTMGSVFHIALQRVEDPLKLIKDFKAQGIRVYATSPHEGENYFDCNFIDSVMFVIGAEGKGISQEVLNEVDNYTSIPIVGKAESLNAAMATGIILYEVVRQRQNLSKA